MSITPCMFMQMSCVFMYIVYVDVYVSITPYMHMTYMFMYNLQAGVGTGQP